MKEMVGGCCVCSDERGWDENPLVYCDGHGCNVAVHQGTLRACPGTKENLFPRAWARVSGCGSGSAFGHFWSEVYGDGSLCFSA